MSATHEPMHAAGTCPRCDRRRERMAAYEQRMAFRASKAGQKAAAKARMAHITREKRYRETDIRGERRPRPRAVREKNRERTLRRAWKVVRHAMRPPKPAADPVEDAA